MTIDTEELAGSKRWSNMIFLIIKTFLPACKKSTLITYEDMYQEAWMGLLKAAKSYDPDRKDGCKFSTWAWTAIYGNVRRYVERAVERELHNEADPAHLTGPAPDPSSIAGASDILEKSTPWSPHKRLTYYE